MEEKPENNKGFMKRLKSNITPTNLAIVAVTPIVVVPFVFAGIWAYKKYIKNN